MRNPWFMKASVSASGTTRSPGAIALVKARTLSVTATATFNGSGTTDATVYLYYSPDGKNFDDTAYTSFDITVSAGNAIQRTVLVDVPEHGFMNIAVTNGDASYAITDVSVWYTIQSWEHQTRADRGDIRRDTGED